MNWENLKTNQCPHCDSNLYTDQETFHHRCESCYFHISAGRFKSIVNKQSFAWQNLYKKQCPKCTSEIGIKQVPYNVLYCTSENCDFSMKETNFTSMTSNPNHPINRYSDEDDDE